MTDEHTGSGDTGAEEPAPAPLLTLRDGLPPLTDTPEALETASAAIAAGTGPLAIDAERASGHRYSARAYLVQLRRAGAGTYLVDPVAVDSLAPLVEACRGTEWILHAATQDLPCLAELGLEPTRLFDTELAARLLGYPKVGLATLVEQLLGQRLAKEHSAVDWSRRPLPQEWLEYAALDVEVLLELREHLAAELAEQGKAEWAEAEFAHLRSFRPTVHEEPWRRTSGLHRVRGARHLAAARELWQTRDRIARDRDVTPSRIVPDGALVAAARAMPGDTRALLATEGFTGRGARRYARQWVEALERARALPEEELPATRVPGEGPPPPRAWRDRDALAADRLTRAREAMTRLAEQLGMPAENVLTPDTLRRVLWEPPDSREPGELTDRVVDRLRTLGAREWQVALAAPIVVRAVLQAGTADADTEEDPPTGRAVAADDSQDPPAPAASP